MSFSTTCKTRDRSQIRYHTHFHHKESVPPSGHSSFHRPPSHASLSHLVFSLKNSNPKKSKNLKNSNPSLQGSHYLYLIILAVLLRTFSNLRYPFEAGVLELCTRYRHITDLEAMMTFLVPLVTTSLSTTIFYHCSVLMFSQTCLL